MSKSIRGLTIFTLTLATAIASLSHAAAAPALGVLGSFGTSGPGKLTLEAQGIAVDPITGDVYVADREADRIVKYDPSGSFILTFGREVNETKVDEHAPEAEQNVCTLASGNVCKAGAAGIEPGQFDGPAGVAVDPVTGDVYVNASGNKSFADDRVERFTATGGYRSQIVGGQNGAPVFGLPEYKNGIATDTEGNLYIVSGFTKSGEKYVFKFNPAGEYTGQSFVPPREGGPPRGGQGEWSFPTDAAVDASGTLYVATFGGGPVIEFSSGGEALEALPCSSQTRETGLAVNLFNGDVFIAGSAGQNGAQRFVCQFDAAGELVAEFEAAPLGENLEELAYGASAGTLYELGGGRVVMYGPFPLPTQGAPSVSLEDWSNGSETSVTLKARVNPHSLDTTYSFQYATNPQFTGADSAPVSPGDAGSSFLPVSVSAGLTGLAQSTTYYYRLVAHNAFGGGTGTTVDGLTQSFTTLAPLPSVTTEAASEATYDAATVSGTVIPGSTGPASDTTWCFQYGTTDTPPGVYDLGFLPGAPAGDAGQGTGPVAVSVRLPRLAPGTTYRYRLVAVNSLGLRQSSTACGTVGGRESDGAEGVFTTASSAPGPVAVSGPLSALSQNAAGLTGTVDPQGTRTVYDFQLGTSTGYGVDLFGEAGAGTESEPVGVTVSSLQPATTYHYRLVASSRYGTSYGADMSFTTPAVPSSVLSPPPAPPLIATPPFVFPAEAAVTSTPRAVTCKRGYKRDARGRCVKTKPRKKKAMGPRRRRGKGARHRGR